MPSFQYIASGAKGEAVRGIIQAIDRSEVIRKLGEKGLFLISCRTDQAPALPEGSAVAMMPAANSVPRLQAPSTESTSPTRSTNTSSSHENTARGASNWFQNIVNRDKQAAGGSGPPSGKITLKELVIFTRQISISINAGMPFVEALQSLAANCRNPLMAYTIRQVLDDVLSGKKFSDALAAHPDVFKPVYVSMAAAGEAGGFMPDALNRTAEFLEKEIELRSKIRSAMVYPMVIGVVASVVVIGMMAFIVPTFVKVFQDMGAPLPLPTRMLIKCSIFIRRGGFSVPFIFAGLIIYAKKFRTKNERFRVFWDSKVLEIPMFGKLMILEIVTRFIRTLASLVANGVMALQAISVARQVVENRSIESVVDEIFSSVQQGNGISAVLYKSKYFPVLVANMVSTGEKTGAIPEVLTKMADYYDAEVSAAIRDLLTLMEPLLIVVMAIIVGFVIAGLMLPTFQMSSLVN